MRFFVLIFVVLFSSFSQADNQLTISYSVKASNQKLTYYKGIYYDFKNEKLSEFYADNNRNITQVITFDNRTKEINFINYQDKTLSKPKTLSKINYQFTPKIRFYKRDNCSIYYYKFSETNSLIKCFKEMKRYVQLRSIREAKLRELYLNYVKKIGPTIEELPFYDSIIEYSIKKHKDFYTTTKIKEFNYQPMGKNGFKLPDERRLLYQGTKDCIYLNCF